MSQRDILTANRDKRVWAVAKGGDLAVDDSNLPPVTKIKTNLVGPNADESFPFLKAEEAIAKMKVHSGMKVNLFASEEQFPELAKPVQNGLGHQRPALGVGLAELSRTDPRSKSGDSLLVFEDTNGDGKADKCTHFIDNLNGPTGFQFYKDGVLLMQAPDLWFSAGCQWGRQGRFDGAHPHGAIVGRFAPYGEFNVPGTRRSGLSQRWRFPPNAGRDVAGAGAE